MLRKTTLLGFVLFLNIISQSHGQSETKPATGNSSSTGAKSADDEPKTSRADAPLAEYNQACNNKDGPKCNKTVDKLLSCSTSAGKCLCLNEDDLLFDQQKSLCVIKNDGDCSPSSGYSTADCQTNARCTNGKCLCGPNFYNKPNATVGGVCAPELNFNQDCGNETAPCSRFQNLQCITGLCQCNSTSSVYSPENKQCVARATFPCINNKCIRGASCSPASNLCVCTADSFYPNGTDCFARKGERAICSADTECQSGLVCNKGICECSNKNATTFDTSSVYNATTKKFGSQQISKCVGLVDKPCVDGLCVSNAFCVYTNPGQVNSGNLNGTCSCVAGVTKENSFCRVDPGKNCSTAKGCKEGLACVDNVCACEYSFHQLYDNSTKSCKSKIFAPCNRTDDCFDIGVCSAISGANLPSAGHCTCPPGFIDNGDGGCDIEFGKACAVVDNGNSTNPPSLYSPGKVCDRVARLSCVNNNCTCADKFYEFDKENRKCIGLVGAGCNAAKSNSDCISTALCVHPFAKTLDPTESGRLWADEKINSNLNSTNKIGRCRCQTGSTETAEYKCK